MTMPRPTNTAAALLLMLAPGCGQSARDRDCATVREILEPAPAEPRRSYDYQAERKVTFPPLERLRQATWQDEAVRAAVQAMLGEAGSIQSYSHYRRETERQSAADRLAELCGLRRVTVLADE
jgi:hypothetical protein